MIKEFEVRLRAEYPAELIIKFDNGMGFSQQITEMSKDGVADTLIRLGNLIKYIKQETFDNLTEHYNRIHKNES